MSVELVILVSTAVLAVVAVCAAVVAVRAVRAVRTLRATSIAAATTTPTTPQTPSQAATQTTTELARIGQPARLQASAALEPRIVEGRLIVPPTQQQVVATALGRPGVRLSVLTSGLAHALRPESRDRILAMMRREYRRRRRERLQAGRRAARATTPTAPHDSWLGS